MAITQIRWQGSWLVDLVLWRHGSDVSLGYGEGRDQQCSKRLKVLFGEESQRKSEGRPRCRGSALDGNLRRLQLSGAAVGWFFCLSPQLSLHIDFLGSAQVLP